MILKHSTVGMCSDSTLPARVAPFSHTQLYVAEWENAETAKTAGSSAKNIVSSHAPVASREEGRAGAREKEPQRALSV